MAYIRRIISSYRAPLAGACLLLCVMGYAAYANLLETITTEETIYVLPLSITENGWEHVEALYVQDVGERDLFEAFSRRNSAYLSDDAPYAPLVLPDAPLPTTEPSPSSGTDDTPLPSTEDTHDDPHSLSDEVVDSAAPVSAEADPVSVDAPTTEQDTIPEPETTPQPESETQNSEEQAVTPDISAFAPITSFVTRIHERFPLTFVSTDENPESSSDSAVSTEPTPDPSIAEPVPEPPEAHSDTPMPDLGSPEPVADGADITADDQQTESDDTDATDAESIVQTPEEPMPTALPHGPSIVWNGFSLPVLTERETIANAQIRMSLAAERAPARPADEPAPLVRIDYSFGGEVWENAGSVTIDEQVSNAMNGGYFLFALPPILDPNDLRSLEVRAVYQGSKESISALFIDSVWIELSSMRLDREALKARVAPEALTTLEKPEMHELISETLDFPEAELPQFTLRYEEQRSFPVRFVRGLFADRVADVSQVTFTHSDAGEVAVPFVLDETPEGIWTIRLTDDARDSLRPGTYAVDVTVQEGSATFTDRFEFQWGLLALNTHKARYVVGESAAVSLAALSENGNTLCDARLELYVITENDFIRRLPVAASDMCNGNTVIPVPDYTSSYLTNTPGTYELYVEHLADDASVLAHALMTFEVVDTAPFSLERTGPTRVYPVAPYDMQLTIAAQDGFRGTITERVPAGFIISTTTAGSVSTNEAATSIVWDVDLAPGESATLSYQFDAPDISPYLYEIGPATVEYEVTSAQSETVVLDEPGTTTPETAPLDETGTTTTVSEPALPDAVPVETTVDPGPDTVGSSTTAQELTTEEASIRETPREISRERATYTEHRAWQVASDATGSMLLYWASSTIPTGWTCVSCAVSDVFYQRFIVGSATPSVNGGAATHTHTGTAAVAATGATGVSSTGGGGSDAAVLAHGHSLTPTVGTASNLPRYRHMVVIQNNSAGEPASIPTGAIAMFDATVPSGWTQYSALDSYYPYAESTTTVSTTAGSSTHTHLFTGTTGASTVNTNAPGAAGVSTAQNTHTHTISASSTSASNEPPYIEAIFGSLNATSTATDDMIAMWTDTPPTGWGTVSSTSEPFVNRFVRASTTYGATGGASTHTHSDTTGIITSGPSRTVNRTANAANADASGAHTHTVTVSAVTTVSHLPPYRTAIFAKRAGGAAPSGPTQHEPFESELTGTSTPRLEFTGNDPDGADTLTYHVQWDDDENLDAEYLGSSTSSDESGCLPNCFENIITPADTSPFNDNERVGFTIQDPLTSGVTYYWRVRTRETVGDSWGSWSETWSFTYIDATDPAEWYQTEWHQFIQGTTTDVATSSDSAILSVDPPSEAIVAYGEGVVTTPRYRVWDGTNWGTENSALDVGGVIQWVKLKANPTRDEYILGTQDASNDINFQVFASTSVWGNLVEATTSVTTNTRRAFDVGYETISGDAIAVYCGGTTNARYRVWNGTSWTGPFDITTASALQCEYVQVASDPNSDEMIAVFRDTGAQYEALVWDGGTWANSTTLGSMDEPANEGIAVEYESSGDQALVVVSNSTNNNFTWNAWSGTSWNGTSATVALGDDFEWGVLRRDEGTDTMALCYVDNDSDIGYIYWNGLSWQTPTTELTISGSLKTSRPVSCEFETTGARDGYLLQVYGDTVASRYNYSTTSTPSAQGSVTNATAAVVGSTRTGDGTVLTYHHDNAASRYAAGSWNGTTWSTSTIETSHSVTAAPHREALGIAAQLYLPGSGTLVTEPIDFDAVPGQPTWGEVTWNTTEPTGTDVLLQVMVGPGCTTTVPDLALSGNSAGFPVSSSPLDISGLSTSTYNQICLQATFSSSNASDPTLDDWRVSWERKPVLVQKSYRWYVNANALTPTDPWPAGATDIAESTPIEESYPSQTAAVMRLRMGIEDQNVALGASANSFALEYASTTAAACSDTLVWQEVGALGSTTASWRGYNNGAVFDGATLSTLVLTEADTAATYEEQNDSDPNPNAVSVGNMFEYDWVLENNAEPGTEYCFRMVLDTGTPLNEYTAYPLLITNAAPVVPTLEKLFDNEKTPTTTPRFEFSSSDAEANDITYQIQVDDDALFGSVNVDRQSDVNTTQFTNLTTPADKDPFTTGERIEFRPTGAFTNGTTYYWRVRAMDPDGSDTWSEWSDVWSFTIDTSLTASAWFQTEDAQFDTNTLEDTESSGSDSTELQTGFTVGTTTSDAIAFEDGTVGNAWGSLVFTDVETSSDLKYFVEYFSGGEWAMIPDTDLSGNAAGFDSSPVSLLGLDTDTYGTIRLVARLTDSGASPQLQDWTVNWGFKILPPTISKLFPNERQATTTPTLEFVAEDPQNDDLTYQVQWSTTYAFTASTTRTSGTDAGFANIDTPADTNPFFTGDVIQYTIQAADALTNNTTYWWRVRAVDPAGENNYSAFTDPQSFTVDTATVVSTWFQTTQSQFDTDLLTGATTTSGGSVTVATTAVESLIAYAEGTQQAPRYRTWDGTTLSAEDSALSVGAAISWVVTKPGATREEYVMGTLGTDGDVNVQVYQDGTWGDLQELTASVPNTTARGFDIAYETISGDALAVTCDGDADPTYWVWDGTSWTNTGSINLISNNNCAWIKLASDPQSNEIIMVTRDTTGTSYELFVWNGSSWGNNVNLGSMNETGHEGISLAYEESGNQAVVVTSSSTNIAMVWRAWDGSSWTATSSVTLGDDFEAGSLVADVGSDNMALCYVDEDNDIGAIRWTGAGWTGGAVELDTGWAGGNTVKNDRPVDCAFEVGGSRDGFIMVVYSDTTNVRYRYWDTGLAAWQPEADVSTIGDSARVQIVRTGGNIIQALAYDIASNRYDYSSWNGTTWTGFQSIETSGSSGGYPYKEPFMFAVREPGSAASIVGDPQIDFYDGSGPYWQELAWTDTTPGSSDVTYRVQYYDTASSSWKDIPNALIPGNANGTTTSPIDLRDVLPVSTYSLLRPVASLTCVLTNCPTVSDWTLTWAPGINLSGTAQQYDQSTNLTSGTVAVALNGVLQTGKTGTIQPDGTWSISNVNASEGDVLAVFIDGVADSGEAVSVTTYDGVGDISGMNLYERHLSIGSDDNATTTNAQIGLYDSSNDEDLFFDVSSNTLTVCAAGESACGDAELIVKALNTFQPGSGANVVTHDFENNGSFVPNGNTIRVSGSWDNAGTSTMATSTVIMTATSTNETIDITGAISATWNNLTFGETSGTATWTLLQAHDIDGTLAVNFGTLARSTFALNVAGNVTTGANGLWSGVGTTTFDGSGTSNWSDQNAVKQNIGHAVIDGSTKTITLTGSVAAQTITIGANDTLDANTPTSYDITVYGHWTNNNIWNARSGEVIFAATTTGRSIALSGSSFYDLSFNGVGGAWSFASSTLSIANDLSIATGTVTLPTGTTTIAGSFVNTGGVFQHNNGEVRFTSTASETITLGATAFTNGFYDLTWSGSGGTWNMTDTSATTSNNVRILAGTPTFPATRLSIGGSFVNAGGSFNGNSGELRFYGSSDKVVTAGGGSFASLRFDSTASSVLTDTNVTLLGSLSIFAGTTTLPSGTLTLGGSLTNSSVLAHNSGTVLLNSSDTGESITLGNSALYNLTFSSASGGWTFQAHATTTNALTITSVSSLAFQNGVRLAVGGTFTNASGGSATEWNGSTLALYAGTTFSANASTTVGDRYDTLVVGSSTRVSMWHSTATTTTTHTDAYLYSQDNAAVDGELYIYGAYTRSSGTEYWNAARDFDGTALVSPRQVDVRFASGASAVLSNAVLSVAGTSTATTSIAALSGTYTVNVSGGTTTMQYYEFTGLGTSGLTLGTSTIVTSLADGRFVPAVGGGSGLTVASSTIDANPALQIYRVEFSTSSAITATNVTQSGAAPASYWWFRSSTGNINGEDFDNDTGNPGSIRWDDSSYIVTASGTVYSDAGVTPMGNPTCDNVTNVVRVVVNASTSYAGPCDPADGSYEISGVVFNGDPTITAYLDTNGGARGVVVTKTPTGDIVGLDIYQNRVITRHEDTVALSISDMAKYDEDNDADIRFSAATGSPHTLTVRGDTELLVYASTTFTPSGNVTLEPGGTGTSYDATFHIDNNATATAQGTESWSVGGRFQVDVGGAFIPASSTVTMTATSTGKTISSPGTIDFNTLTFSGTGAWDLVANITAVDTIHLNAGTLIGSGDVTVHYGSFQGAGTLAFTGGTTTVARTNTLGSTTPWQFYNLVLGNGSGVGTTTRGDSATTTILNRLTVSTAHTLSAGSSRWDLRGSTTPFVINGTFTEGTSFVRYGGSGATTIASDTYYDLDVNAVSGTPTFSTGATGINVLGSLSVGGQSASTLTFDAGDPVVSVTGNVLVRPNGTLIGSNSSAFSVLGNWDNDGTYTASGGTVTFAGSGTQTISAGASPFANVTVNGGGTHDIVEHATATSAFTITLTGGFTVQSGVRLAVGGTFSNNVNGALTTWTGSTLHLYSGTQFETNAKSNDDTYGTLTLGAQTDVRMWNSSAASVTLDATASLYSMDHANNTGDLYIYGEYGRSSGTDYWGYAYDFDGTPLGGASRKVDVFMASGATAYYTGGGLWMVGDSAASTTVTNQGSGTYQLMVGGTASTTMRYYEMRDMAVSGLVFTGAPTVHTISNGDFIVSQASGSALTVGGSAITQNPAKTFTNNRFATSTAIGAYNVTATGTTVSSWRFTNEVGNLAGEAYDEDPGGDPGYVVWTTSAANITVAGRVYSDEGSTVSGVCDDLTTNIRLVVAGVTTYDAYCESADGDYSIPGVTFSANDTVTLFINGETEKAATVSIDPVSSISDMDLYENRVILRHENTDPITIADIAAYDSTDDADIPFTAVDGVSDTLSLPANRKLIVWTAKTFAPAGAVTVLGGGGGASYDGTLELFTNAVFTAAGTESHTVGGSMVLGTGASFTAAQSTFTLTTTGAARTIDTNEDEFYNLILNGSGSWSVGDTTMTVSNDMTITAGAITLPVGTTTVGGSFVNNGGTFTQTTGTLALTSTASGETLRMGGSTVNRLVVDGVGGAWTMTGTNATTTLSVRIAAGTLTFPSGTFAIGSDLTSSGTIAHNSGTVRLTGTTTNGLLRTGGSSLSNVTFDGSGSYLMGDSSLALAGSLTINQGAVTFATNTLSVAGSLTATGGTFDHASGTVLMNSTDAGETVTPGASRFYNLTFQGASGGWTVSANATTTNNLTLTSAASFRQASSTTFEVHGVFTNSVGGSATNWDGSTLLLSTTSTYAMNLKANTGDRYNILSIGSSTKLTLWNSQATTTLTATGASLYSQDHAAVDGELYIFGEYTKSTGSDYWNYAIDFDGTVLTGGSRRAVTVRHAANATTTISGSATLNVVGDSTASTTVTNQGSGTYSVQVLAGTFNASQYRFRNLGVGGVELSGTTTVSSLSSGDWELAVSGGTLLSVASSTVNANASAVHTGVRFATTTAITGTNVAVTGGTTSAAWTFTTHTGNLSGEAYDSDGLDSCGSIRWSDSSCLLLQQAHYRWRNDDGGEGAPNSEWYNASWTKRQRVVVTNTDATTYTNAAVKVVIPFDADMQANFEDLRFTSVDGTTLLNHWREKSTASTEATVWVEVPSLTASADTSVYMYYGNALASETSSGTTTFSAFDDFEDDNITEYSGDTSQFNVGTTYAYDRTYGLDASGNENSQTTDGIYRTALTMSQGETIRYFQYITTTTGSTDEACTLFGVQSPGSNNNNYAVCLPLFGVDRVTIAENVSSNEGSGTVLASSTITYATGWHEVEIDWLVDDTIFVSVYRDDVLVATTSVTDVSYTTGGIGFSYWFQHGGWDTISSRPYVATDPSVRFGVEQSANGASWLAALDTFGSSFTASTTARVRFVLENTGLLVSGKQFALEYAEKGVAPSCESVAGGSYTAVPAVASCGSSPICMANSTHVSHLASTTDQLGGEGQFTYGQIAENTSNMTGSLDLAADSFTEVEYVLVPTQAATAGSYCLRVTDNGDALDGYTRVAEMRLRYDPSVTGVVLNGGSDITLSPGATTTVSATATLTDLNGYADIVHATATLYRSSVAQGAQCAADNNSCYQVASTSCALFDCSGYSCTVSCSADVYYFADPTDSGTYIADDWRATIGVVDTSSGYGSGVAAIPKELLTLRALDVTQTIDYGSLESEHDTGAANATTTISNIGNDAIDISIAGTNLANGSSTIPVNSQKFATSTFSYSSCTQCSLLATSTTNLEVDLAKPTAPSSVEDDVFWGISIPFGVAATAHEGQNTFYAIGD